MRKLMVFSYARKVLVCLAIGLGMVHAQTTQFSYQGSLKDGANPANGNYDFEFVLYDAPAGGTQLGSTNSRNSVAVINGIFGVNLDFGNQFSSGDNRWLEVRIRLAGQPGITILTPRQGIATVPYAMKSSLASMATTATTATSAATATNALQLGGVAANQFVVTGDARLSDARNPLPNSASYIQNQNVGAQAASNFHISGNGTAGGTLSGNVVNAVTQLNINGLRTFTVNGSWDFFGNFFPSTNTFAGARAGQSTTPSPSLEGLTGKLNSFVGAEAGRENTTGFDNSFFGFLAGSGNTTGYDNSFFGYGAGAANTMGNQNTAIGSAAGVDSENLTNATAIGARARVTANNSLVLGSINGVNAASSSVNVGIGTTAPITTLYVQSTRNTVGENTATFRNNALGANQSHIHYGTTGDWFIRSAGSTGKVVLQDTGGNVGIGTSTPGAKLDVRGGSVFIAQPNSLIITSPNGACWFITVNNSGALSTISVACP